MLLHRNSTPNGNYHAETHCKSLLHCHVYESSHEKVWFVRCTRCTFNKICFPTVFWKKERETLFCFASTNRLSFKKSASSLANRVFVYVTARKYHRAACRVVLSEPIKKKDQSRLDKKKRQCKIIQSADWTKNEL